MDTTTTNGLYTKFNIDHYTLIHGFGIELGFIDCACDTPGKLIAEINKLTQEQFDAAMAQLDC